MPLKRVPLGTIPYGYEPPMLRKRREIEQDLAEEHQDYLDKRNRGKAERFSRPLEGQVPFENSPERYPDAKGNEAPDKRDIKYNIVPQSGVQSAGERSDSPIGGVLHYTGSEKDTVESLRENSLTRGRGGFGYNYVIDKEGVVHQMTPLNDYTKHIEGPFGQHRTDTEYKHLRNNNTVSIGLIGDENNRTPKQIESARDFTKDLARAYGWQPRNVVSHADLQSGPGGSKSPKELYDVARYVRANLEEAGIRNTSDPTAKPEISPQQHADIFDYTLETPGGEPNYNPFTTGPNKILREGEPSLANRDIETRVPMPGTASPTTEVAATPSDSASSVSQVPSSSGSLPTFAQLFGIETPIGARKGSGPGAFKNQVTVPSMEQLSGTGSQILQAAGPEDQFPSPPPPPPRTPPGMDPPLANKRRRGRFA